MKKPKQIVKVIISTHKGERTPENKILEILQKVKLRDRDWEKIRKEREER